MRHLFPSRNIPCEYVWYDFWIPQGLTRDGVAGVVGGHTLAKKQARGSTSWFFASSGESVGVESSAVV